MRKPTIPGKKCKQGKQIYRPPYLSDIRWRDCAPLEPAASP